MGPFRSPWNAFRRILERMGTKGCPVESRSRASDRVSPQPAEHR